MELKQRVALITGSAIRVGRAIALELAQGGANIVVHYYHHAEKAERTVDELLALGVKAQAIQAHVARANEVEALFRQAEESLGPVDILVNNAAIFERAPFPELSESDWDEHMDINLKGVFLCCRAAARRMIQRGRGKIINIADVFGSHPWPAYLPYCVSKAGVITLTQTLALALAKTNIQVNAVGPGAILLPEDYSPAMRQEVIDRVPAGRLGAPDDIARTVRFLIEGPDYITGALVPVDGGASLT